MSNIVPPSDRSTGVALDPSLHEALRQTNLLSFADSSSILRSYRIIGTLGSGNSPVYLVRKLPDDEHRSDFAMKVILRSSEREFNASLQEVTRTREFSGTHHIVSILDADSAKVSAYGSSQYAVIFLMPIYANYSKPVSFYWDGKPVRYEPWSDVIREADLSATLSVKTLNRLYVIRDVALALNIIARAGRVHRDVKPENIMCTPGSVNAFDRAHLSNAMYSLGDFGEAETDVHLTQHARGTPLWMAPEVAGYCAPTADIKHTGAYQVDIRSDVYSLGLVLYAMFCHWQPPFLAAKNTLVPENLLSDEGRKAMHRVSASSGGLSTGFQAVRIRSSVAPQAWPALALFADRPLSDQEANIRDRIWYMIVHMCAPEPEARWSPEEVNRYVSRLITEISNSRVQPVPAAPQETGADQTQRAPLNADGTLREELPDEPAVAPVKPAQVAQVAPAAPAAPDSASQSSQSVSVPQASVSQPAQSIQPAAAAPNPFASQQPAVQDAFGFLEPIQDYGEPEGSAAVSAQGVGQGAGAFGFLEPIPDYIQPAAPAGESSDFLGAAPQPAYGFMEPIQDYPPAQPARKRANPLLLIIIIAVVLLLLLGGGAAAVLLSSMDSGDEAGETHSAPFKTTEPITGASGSESVDTSITTPVLKRNPTTDAPAATVTATPTREPARHTSSTATPTPVVTAPVVTADPNAALQQMTNRPTSTPYAFSTSKVFSITGESYGRIYRVNISLDEDGRIDYIYINASGLNEGHGKLCGGDQTKKFPSQFIGRSGPFELGVNVDAVTNATITSGDIVDLINESLEDITSGQLR